MVNSIILLLVFSLLQASTSVLEIVTFQREGNTVQLQCREEQFNGQPPTELHNVSLFLFNSTGQSVTSLLVENNIDYDFDSRGVLSFEVQQNIEGYYYCSRDKSAGLPDDEDDYETILAHPSRVNVPTEYIIQVGEPVTLVNGVGEGALAEHYSATWFKDGLPLADANVSRGKDFSLHIEAVEFMDAGEYLSSVTIQNDNGAEYTVLENDHPIQLTVYESPVIKQDPKSIVMDEGSKVVSLNCVVTGTPSLRVSWFKGVQNLTFSSPSHYSINESRNNSRHVTSTLTILHPTYKDSGRYVCISTILNDETGDDKFRALKNTTLTIIESDFALRTVVTEHQQLQLWIDLHIPIFDAVTAVVYFTLKEKQYIQQQITTNSVLTENTILVFQLESHEIPENFQKEDFLVQVALQVGTTKGSVVPRSLQEARTSNLDRPTVDCNRDVTYRVGIIAICSIIGLVVVMGAVLAIACCLYKLYRAHQKAENRQNMSEQEKQRIGKKIDRLLDKLEKALANESLDKKSKKIYVKRLEKYLDLNEGLLAGDGSDEDD